MTCSDYFEDWYEAYKKCSCLMGRWWATNVQWKCRWNTKHVSNGRMVGNKRLCMPQDLMSTPFVIYTVGEAIFCYTNRLLSRKELWWVGISSWQWLKLLRPRSCRCQLLANSIPSLLRPQWTWLGLHRKYSYVRFVLQFHFRIWNL